MTEEEEAEEELIIAQLALRRLGEEIAEAAAKLSKWPKHIEDDFAEQCRAWDERYRNDWAEADRLVAMITQVRETRGILEARKFMRSIGFPAPPDEYCEPPERLLNS